VEEAAGILAVRADPPDDRRQMNDELGTSSVAESPHVVSVPEIVFSGARNEDVFTTRGSQALDDVRPEKPRAPGDCDSLTAQVQASIEASRRRKATVDDQLRAGHVLRSVGG
jgi:hypothetical protein